MGEGKPSSTPGAMQTHTGDATSTHGANTNLDPQMQGGPSTGSDAAATQIIQEQHQAPAEGSHLPDAVNSQSDPARQMDNSGMLHPTGEGEDADLMGASGVDRNAD